MEIVGLVVKGMIFLVFFPILLEKKVALAL